jgi:hypothetical protein
VAKSRQRLASSEPEDEAIPIEDWLETITTHLAFLPSLTILTALLVWLSFDPRLSIIGDNAEFITLGRAIAQGHGLTYINTVEQLPATKYPFGFPLVLAVVHLLYPFSLSAMKILVAATFVLSVPLIYKVVARLASPVHAVWAVGFSMVSIYTLHFGSLVLSEVPYMLTSLITIWLILEADEKDTIRSHGIAVLSLMVTYYVRSIGISLVVAAVAYFLIKGKSKLAAGYGGACLILALPWQIRTQMAGGPSYVRTWLLSADPYTLEGTLGFSGLINRIFSNIYLYTTQELPRVFWPSFFDYQYAGPLDLGWIGPALGIILSLLFIVSLVRGLWGGSLLALYLLFYLGVCLLWPEVWASVRLLIPVIPFITLGVIQTIHLLASKVRPTVLPHVAVASFGMLYCISNVSAITRHLDYVQRQPANYRNYFRAADWIRTNTPEDAVICCRKSYLMFVTANRKTTSYKFTTDPDALIQDLTDKGVDHVVVSHLSNSTPRYLVPAIQANMIRFESLHVVPNPDTYVLRFK